MYNPRIEDGYAMYRELFNKHANELYTINLKFEKITYDDGMEQIVPNVYAEFKR